MKQKSVFVCQECGATFAKWMGRCTACGAWNAVIEEFEAPKQSRETQKAVSDNKPRPMREIDLSTTERWLTGIDELDNVLGGGLVPGSMVLMSGEPGIGKSTLLLQLALEMAKSQGNVLYVSGEESAAQVRMRAERLGALADGLWLLSENDLSAVLHHARKQKAGLLIVDSVQTVYLPELTSAPGSVTQVRQCGSELLHLAKDEGMTVILVGHVTKEGTLAGPRVLEHMVDTVLYFEGDRISSLRLLRASKNRFGSTNELGVFEMTSAGLLPLSDPSGVFLTRRQEAIAGSAVGCALQGSRPVLLEVQALTSPSNFGNPRRLASGIDYNRLLIILAVLEKKLGIALHNQDVYVNVTGGLKVADPALDLAVAAAILSSHKEKPLPADMMLMGEIGLTGELRQPAQADRRATEAGKLGFASVVTAAGKPISAKSEIKVITAYNLADALKKMGI